MKNIPLPILSPEMSYSDIIVPTMDFVRGAYLIEKLLMNNKKVVQTLYDVVIKLSDSTSSYVFVQCIFVHLRKQAF